jgi:hypothetical protein
MKLNGFIYTSIAIQATVGILNPTRLVLRIVFLVSLLTSLLILLISGACNSDTSPPDPSAYNDTRPRLVVSLTGFNPGSRVYLRHWEANTAFTYPSGYALYVDVSGHLLTEIVLSLNTTLADVLIYVDQSANGILDAADFGIYTSGIVINTSSIYTYVNVPYQAATLTAYSSTTGLPTLGQQKICIYMPAAKPSWSSSSAASMPEYPDMHGAIPNLSDWFPVSVVTSTGIAQTFPRITALGALAYNETCVLDANSNGKYDSGETVTVSGVNVP